MVRFSGSLFRGTSTFNDAEGSVSPAGTRESTEVDTGGMKATFVDASAMKEKVRQNLTKPQYSVKDYYKTTGVFPLIATSAVFESVTLGVIAFNALWIAVDTDFNDAEILVEAHPVFIVAENMFCTFFFFEWCVRFMSFKCKKYCLKDAWFMFDSFMVFMMAMETWVMSVVMLCVGNEGSGTGDASILRVARLLRLSRLARMARLLRALPELMIMIRGMVAATRSVFFTLCLLIIVMYVFAIAFTQLCAETPVGNDYFRSVPASMFTLLIYGTLLDNIGLISKDLGNQQLYIAALFFLFVLLAALTIMNMLIGVLCEVVNAVAATEKEEMLVTYVNRKLLRVVQLLDSDGGGTISKSEFMQILENADAVRCLQDVGVDVIGLVDYSEYIFEADGDDEVELDFGKFMEVVLQLRGTNSATVKDIVDLRKFVRMSLLETNRLLQAISKDQQTIRNKLGVPSGVSVYHGNHHGVSVHNTLNSEKGVREEDQGSNLSPGPTSDTSDKDSKTTPKREALKDLVRESECLNALATSFEELRESPQKIANAATESPPRWGALSGSPPLPLQPSPLVHLLSPDFEEDFTSSGREESKQGIQIDQNANSAAPALTGHWYPHNSGSTSLFKTTNNVNSVAATHAATDSIFPDIPDKAEDVDTHIPQEGLSHRASNNLNDNASTR